ncbi:MAG: bifunctional aldolase/short-chain dehydrogenase [Alphaproteobacteria bacterium]|nr:bifunctional aldolase/short-chain dehydrogenase [Alphaproteobacteria bacterium]
MKSRWSDDEAKSYVARYGRNGVNADRALRVYTTRLLGQDPRLVLHGGGNTSVKTRMRDTTGEQVDVLCVKGSGWDMGDIEPAGLPAVRLEPLKALIGLKRLSDEDMVNLQRRNLLDASAPNPSVETLLHAFLPHKFVDHSHANAVLALTDQPDGEKICAEVFGDRAALVPYVMPGFDLAKACAKVHAAHPDVEGLILLKHGIFSFGATAREAYERMIRLVTLAERRIKEGKKKIVFAPARRPKRLAKPAEIAPILRGLLAMPADRRDASWRRLVLTYRTSPAIRAYVNGRALGRYSQSGTVTPDHAIRTKPLPVILPAPKAGALDEFAKQAKAAIGDYKAHYRAYFKRNNPKGKAAKMALDPMPHVLLVPGLGLFAAGNSAKAAAIAGDLAETTVDVVTAAERIGRFVSISEADLFDIEYWSLEQAKLGKAAEPPLARHIVAITGGAGTIGRATAAAFKAEGAAVALLDLPGPALDEAARGVGALAVPCDVTDDASVVAAFARVAEAFGGVDILVSNAGAAWQGRIGELDDAVLRQSFELNFFGHQRVAKAAVATMKAQGTGGVLLFNTSKQAVNPGADFGPYGLPKAATLFLSRQYAVDHGRDGIRSNAVNADRIRGGLLTDQMVAERAKARGVSQADYMAGNLLGREVTASDVADAFVRLALSRKTTGAVLTVDGGNIAAALR